MVLIGFTRSYALSGEVGFNLVKAVSQELQKKTNFN